MTTTALDDLWDFDDPAASETRFRAAIEAAVTDGDLAAADESRTQLARSIGLQDRFAEGHRILDQVDLDHPAEDRVRAFEPAWSEAASCARAATRPPP